MPQPKLTIAEKLTKYKISTRRYNDETNRLLAAGFSTQQAEKMIVQAFSKNVVESVLSNYDVLLRKPYNFSRDQIASISTRGGGAQAIKTLVEYHKSLQELHFTSVQIVAIASKDGGAQAMKTLLSSHHRLQKLHFTNEQIGSIACNSGGAQAMKTLLECHKALQKLQITNEQIVAIASNIGGAQAMKALLESHKTLNELGFSNEQIVFMATKKGGAQVIKTALEIYPEFPDYSPERIITLASGKKGAKKTKTNNTDKEFEHFVRDYLLPLLTDDTPDNIDAESPDTSDNTGTFIDDTDEDGFNLFNDFLDTNEHTQPSIKNSTALNTLGHFATTTSSYKPARSLDNSIENPREQFLRQRIN